MTLFEHLDELRSRLLKTVVMLVLVSVVCFSLSDNLFAYLRGPLDGLVADGLLELRTIGPLEGFITKLKLAVLAAIFISAPWILLQIWLFVSPGLYRHEKSWVLPFVFFGTLFFVGGAAFCYKLVIPIGFEYMVVQFTPPDVLNEWSIGKYFSVVIRLLLGFGIIFEVPLLMWILSAAGIVAPQTFSRFRKYWIVLAWVLAALLTPADPFTQAMMAVPLMFFFELGLLGGRLLYRRHEEALSE